ncbi:MAG: ribonuclease III [Clostridiales bacterium]|nr:ribonuclease III [Clostridiales bacterium]
MGQGIALVRGLGTKSLSFQFSGGIRMRALEERIGYRFANKALLKLALTHPSALEKKDNQRLEFLGDAVLEYCVSTLLYEKYGAFSEGELTARRAALVCEETLSNLAEGLSLGRYLRMGHGEEATGGREKPAILADAMEAVIAAVCLDGGMDAAKELAGRLFEDDETLAAMKGRDDKGELQAYTQAQGLGLPEYTVLSEEGPPHDRRYTVAVTIAGKRAAEGTGGSKKTAEQNAAHIALQQYSK